MKRILLVVLVVVSAMSGAVAGSMSLSAPQRQMVAGASASHDVAVPALPVSHESQQSAAQSGQAAATTSASSISQASTSQSSAPAQTEAVRTSESITSAPTGVVCPDGSTRPKCLAVISPQPLPVPCEQEAKCSRPISGRPRLPICPHGNNTQGVCSPMTH